MRAQDGSERFVLVSRLGLQPRKPASKAKAHEKAIIKKDYSWEMLRNGKESWAPEASAADAAFRKKIGGASVLHRSILGSA